MCGKCVWKQQHKHLRVHVDSTPVHSIIDSHKLTTPTYPSTHLSRDVHLISFSPVVDIADQLPIHIFFRPHTPILEPYFTKVTANAHCEVRQ